MRVRQRKRKCILGKAGDLKFSVDIYTFTLSVYLIFCLYDHDKSQFLWQLNLTHNTFTFRKIVFSSVQLVKAIPSPEQNIERFLSIYQLTVAS